mmetsp:Transcript_12585/g.25268  ORF Transcript_12585/g.25268 Transcript_12585/m.25268 type:complete len:106 (+) Transcript_12585:271-588(+)
MGLSAYYFKYNSYSSSSSSANNAMNGMMERIGIMVVGCALCTTGGSSGGGAQNITASTILKMAEEEEVADHNLSLQMSNLLLLGLQRTFHRNQGSVEWQTEEPAG